MKAAVLHEYGKPMLVEDVVLGAPQAGEVRVKVAACAICHSDVLAIQGAWGYSLPAVFGHEASGTVVEVGEGVTRVQVGDRVVVSLLRSCGQCYQCSRGLPNLCEGKFALQSETRLHTLDGAPILQGIATAAFAEETVVHQSQVVKMPADFPFEQASLLACGVITGLGAVVNKAKVSAGSTVAVIGAGGVGINSVQGARLSGASRIIVVDVRDDKLEAAKRFGATHTVNGRNENAVEAVKALTDGFGVDYAFISVGNSKVINQGAEMVRMGGTAVIVGLPSTADRMVEFDSFHLGMDRAVMGTKMGTTKLQTDIPRLIDLYNHGQLMLDELISARFTLDQINEAVESSARGEAIRNVIVFE